MTQEVQSAATEQANIEDHRISSLAELGEFFDRESVAYQPDDTEPFIAVELAHGGLDNVIVLRWDAENGFLNIIETLPFDIPEDRYSELETAMLRINAGNVYPGLGINYVHGIPMFRMAMPLVPRGYLLEHEIRVCLDFTMKQTERWFPKLNAVVNGEIRGDDFESLVA